MNIKCTQTRKPGEWFLVTLHKSRLQIPKFIQASLLELPCLQNSEAELYWLQITFELHSKYLYWPQMTLDIYIANEQVWSFIPALYITRFPECDQWWHSGAIELYTSRDVLLTKLDPHSNYEEFPSFAVKITELTNFLSYFHLCWPQMTLDLLKNNRFFYLRSTYNYEVNPSFTFAVGWVSNFDIWWPQVTFYLNACKVKVEDDSLVWGQGHSHDFTT